MSDDSPSQSPQSQSPTTLSAAKAKAGASGTQSKPAKGGVHETRVEAMVRVRPFSKRELEKLRAEDENGIPQSIVHMKGRRVSLLDHTKKYQEVEAFDFDEAFFSIPEDQWAIDLKDDFLRKAVADMGIHCVGQEEVFEKTGARVVQHAFDGFHSCIFAYGQTGAGKTYTMLGSLDSSGGMDSTASKDERGICPRLVEELFNRMQYMTENGDNTIFTVELSFMEIYKEKCKDLLRGRKGAKKKTKEELEKDFQELRVRQSPTMGTYVEGLQREEVKSPGQCMKLMAYGMECRHTAATKMNDVSSRSHAIFQITFKQQNPVLGMNTLSNINLVDLAGSERIKMSGAEGARFDEATKINLSLTTLRHVIDVLIENAKNKKGPKRVPPYRESMLTWLLSESLGGNSKTIMIAAVSPFYGNFEDTANTLRYANKAKEIVCKAKRNDERGAVVVAAMRAEMERLKQQLEAKADVKDEEVKNALKQQLAMAEEDYNKAKKDYEKLQDLGRELREKHEAIHAEIKARDETVQNLKKKKAETTELREKRAVLEKEAHVVGAKAQDLKTKLKHTEAKIEETRKEKEQLKEEEKELRRKEEETRLEMQLTKQRQLALAFRNSLQIHKDRKFMDTLASQQTTAKEKFQKIENQLELKKVELAKLQDTNRHLTIAFDQAQQKLTDLNRNYEDNMELLTEKIHRLAAARKKAEQDRAHYQADIAKTEAALEKLKLDKERETEESNSRLLELEREYHQTVAENEEADRLIAEAQQEVAQAKAQRAALQDEHKKLADQNATVSKELSEVESEHKELVAVNRALLSKVAEAQDQLAATDRQKSDVQAQINMMTDEIKRITRNHEDLKRFVSNRFFPTGQVHTLVDPHPHTKAPASPSSKWEPKPTLKVQAQMAKKAQERSLSQQQTAPKSARGSRYHDPSRVSGTQTTPGTSRTRSGTARSPPPMGTGLRSRSPRT